MNLQTETLAKQAAEYAIEFATQDQALYIPKLMEKFAELIVKECMQSIEKTIETNCDTDSEKMGCEFAITDLLEHFGVEE